MVKVMPKSCAHLLTSPVSMPGNRALPIPPDSAHIRRMTNSPKNPSGFEERPQAPFEGVPYSGSVSDWVRELEADAAKESRKAETREIRSKAGTHRIKAGKPMDDSVMRTSRGTSIGGSSDPKTRAAAGLNPVAGMDVSLEDADSLMPSGVTATVDALTRLITEGNPLFKNGEQWLPHRPVRPEKSEGGIRFEMVTDFTPSGDQPTAIKDLVEGLQNDDRTQVLLGVTGSGKTFTAAQVIQATQRPAVILAPNKTLAAQLYGEMKSLFPNNAVEYFVSYYD